MSEAIAIRSKNSGGTVGSTSVPLVAVLTAIGITLAAAAILLVMKHVPIGHYAGDFVAILDGGYRIAQGQWPHRDFSVPHGAWPLVQGWISLKLAALFAPFLTYQLTQWLTAVLPALYLASRQRNAWRALLVLGIVAVATLFPFLFGNASASDFDYYGGYNRLTTALLFLTFVWGVTPLRRNWAGASVIAYLLFAMLATKVTGFVVGFCAVGFFAILSPVKRSLALRAALLLLSVIVALEITTHLPSAYVHDIRAMAALNKGGIAYAALSVILKSLPGLLALGVLAVLVAPHIGYGSKAVLARPLVLLRSWRAPLLVVIIGLGTLASESQDTGGLLLIAATALLLAPLPLARSSAAGINAAKVALAFAILGPWLGGIIYSATWIAVRDAPQATIDPAVARLLPGTVVTRETIAVAGDLNRISRGPNPPQAFFAAAPILNEAAFVDLAQSVDAAADAARQHGFVNSATRVMTVASLDYFARRLDARSPVGINLWQQTGRTFGTPSPADMRHYLRNVDAAFMRRCNADKSYSDLNQLFRPALQADFSEHDLTPCWEIWTRIR
ncbi:MAG: hypothetical protein AB1508_14895 [Pseudomonadota bacterium]